MTPSDRARALIEAMYILGGPVPPQVARIVEQSITAAVEDEREACARIVDAGAEGGQVGQFILPEIAALIRARSPNP